MSDPESELRVSTLRDYITRLNETGSILGWMWRNLLNSQARRYFMSGVVATIIMRVLDLSGAWVLGLGLTALAKNDSHGALLALYYGLITQAIKIFFEWLSGRQSELLMGEAMLAVEHYINVNFFKKDLALHVDEHKLLNQVSIEKGRSAAEQVCASVSYVAIGSLAMVVVTALILLAVNPVSGLILLIGLIANLALSGYFNFVLLRDTHPLHEKFSAIRRTRFGLHEAYERVVMSGRHEEDVATLNERFIDAIGDDRVVFLKYIRESRARDIVSTIALAAVALYAGGQVLDHTISIAEFVSAFSWLGLALGQVRELGRTEREIAKQMPYLISLRKALELEPRVFDRPNAIELEHDTTPRIQIENVGYRYKSGPPVLKGVSLTIEPGEQVAIIGHTGCGKSSLVKLILRLADPTHGRILIDGHDLRDVKLSSLHRLIGYIPQRPMILDDTLRNNLLYALEPTERAAMTDEALWAFMREFRIDFGDRLEHGLDTRLGKNGITLSGGAAQRVIIGAAAIKRPRILASDEATSALDGMNEATIQEAIKDLSKKLGASALLVAHRLSTVAHCDKFVVMRPPKDGEQQIEAIAHSIDELRLISPTFRDLLEHATKSLLP